MYPRTARRVQRVVLWAALALSACKATQWEEHLDLSVTSDPVLAEDTAFFAGTDFGVLHHLHAMSLATGVEAWRIRLRGWETYTRLATDGEVVLAASPEYLRAFSARSGEPLWLQTLDAREVGPLEVSDGIVSLTLGLEGGDRELLLASLTGGGPARRLSLAARTPVWRGGVRVYLGREDRLEAVDARTGQVEWATVEASGARRVLPAGEIVVAVCPSRLVGLGVGDGQVRWEKSTDGQVDIRFREGLGCYAQAGMVLAIDLATGDTRWHRRVSGVVDPPLMLDETILIHTAGGLLLALGRKDGRPVWSLHVGPPGMYAAASDTHYAWMGSDAVHVVDLVRREPERSIPLERVEQGDPGVEGPGPRLGIGGRWLWLVDGRTRLVVRSLEP